MQKLKVFWERYPDLRGDDLALTVDIAKRLSTADLRYRSLIAQGLGLAIWTTNLGVCFALPLVATVPALWLIELWLDSEVARVWVLLALYLCFVCLSVARYTRHPRVMRITAKVQRRKHIYGAAIAFKRMVLQT